ncbi:MAG: T9SS type A sorting domain-containing protein [Flavobacteriales bacterium]|nr:T9SS type A sorting domain-containing protein [Flavobacteriales bacterium]
MKEEPITITGNQSTITITSNSKATITIFDLTGRTVHASNVSSGTNTISLKKSGIYLVRAEGESGMKTQKVYLD